MATIKGYNVPIGPKNLIDIFPSVDFSDVVDYYIEIGDENNDIIATSPVYQMDQCRSDEDKVRIFFLNYIGGIQAFNFKLFSLDHETSSSPVNYPLIYPWVISTHSGSRINVRSNDVYKAIRVIEIVQESDKDIYKELLDSPKAWIQSNDSAVYLPIVITDSKSRFFTREDMYQFELTIEFKMSHENVIIRG